MPAMNKLKLSIAAKISRAWPAPTVVLYLIVGSEGRDTQLELGIQRTSIPRNKLYGTLQHPLSSL